MFKPFEVSVSAEIWNSKYRFNPPDGDGDADFGQTAARVARAMAQAEVDDRANYWEERFQDTIRNSRFIPAGRVLAGAGTNRTVTLFNCFVMGTIPDSLEGIFEQLKEAALTMQQG